MRAPTLAGRTPEQLEELAVELGQPRYRGRQLAQWIYERGIADLAEASNLPVALRTRLLEDPGMPTLEVAQRQDSPDGTGRIADNLARSSDRVHVLHRKKKEGLGAAYRALHGSICAEKGSFVPFADILKAAPAFITAASPEPESHATYAAMLKRYEALEKKVIEGSS